MKWSIMIKQEKTHKELKLWYGAVLGCYRTTTICGQHLLLWLCHCFVIFDRPLFPLDFFNAEAN